MVWAQLAISTHQITRYQVYVAFVWGSYNPYHLLPEPEWSYDQMDILIKFLHQKKQHFAPKNGGCQTILSFLGFKDLISKCVCVACCGGVSFAKKTNENFIHQPTDFTNANVLKIPEGFKTLGDFEVVTTICANISLKKSPNNQKKHQKRWTHLDLFGFVGALLFFSGPSPSSCGWHFSLKKSQLRIPHSWKIGFVSVGWWCLVNVQMP